MAQITIPFASFHDGLVVLTIVYNDATLNITRVRCVNNSTFPAQFQAYDPVYGTFTWNVPATTTATQNVSQYHYIQPPVTPEDPNPGLSLGTTELRAGWPA